MIRYFLLHGILTIFIFTAWVMNNNESSGGDGMTPLATAFAVGIQFCVGTVIFLMIKNRINRIQTKIIGIILYAILYEFSFLVFDSNLPITRIYELGFAGELNRAFSASSIIALLITSLLMIVIWIFVKSKEIETIANNS